MSSEEIEVISPSDVPMPVPKTADDYPMAVQARAYEAYLKNADVTSISIDMGISVPVLKTWIKKGGWLARRKAEEEALLALVENQYRIWAGNQKQPEAQAQLNLARALQTEIGKNVATAAAAGVPLTDMQLKRLSEALASVTVVSARAVQLSDKPQIDYRPAGGGQQRPTLILIGAAAQVREVPAINVDSTEVE